ncbi:hypothetical protein like AT3G25270 [Hibiscus trionum]|uniref:RNase H type-1 domain-containing protein n=1 Tax=Hibiscus trionum TaxID=183268 RepID=A0A9W7M8S0_HIBTR|nr:hypothetical protein like AT3G25270 [Hibiscus trionum]
MHNLVVRRITNNVVSPRCRCATEDNLHMSRNKLVNEGKNQRIEDLVTFIQSYCSEVDSLATSLHHPHTHDLVRCRPLSSPLVKVNIDKCFISGENKPCSRIIVRDENGHVLGSGFRVNFHIPSCFSAEALAIVQGLLFALDVGFHDVHIESDSKSSISRANSRTSNFSEMRPYTYYAKRLTSCFSSCIFSFIGRKGNRATHAMAFECLRCSFDCSWVEDAPEQVLKIVDDDRLMLDPT